MKTIILAVGIAILFAMPAYSRSGIATYYTHGRMADGTVFGSHGSMFCAAERHVKLGTKYHVVSFRTKRSIDVIVRDHGPLENGHLDLSSHAFRYLFGGTDSGVEKIRFNKSEAKTRKRNNKHVKH